MYPEVNRNYNIGEKGVNMNSQVFKQYLTQMSFNQELVYHSAFVAHDQCTFILAVYSLQPQLNPSPTEMAGITAINVGRVSMQCPCFVSTCTIFICHLTSIMLLYMLTVLSHTDHGLWRLVLSAGG